MKRKRFAALILVLVMCLSLCACAEKDAEQTEIQTEAVNESVQVQVPAESEPPQTEEVTIPPEELFAAVGTLEAKQIMDNKALTYVYEIEDGEELSKKLVLDRLSGEQIAETPEEVRYIVNIKYCASRAGNYIGPAKVFRCSIIAEVVDVLTGEVIAEETFAGAELPDQVVTNTGSYYGDYPDEALAQEWALEVLKTERPRMLEEVMETVEKHVVGRGWSYADILDDLYRYGDFTAVEVRYAADNCGADWNEEAIICAQYWLGKDDGYSPQELIGVLTDISGFTSEQATYGVENCGADWDEQALKVAKSFLKYGMGYSYNSMILVMTGDYGFTEAQAEYAASNCGADWNQVAVDHVVLFLEYAEEPYTRERMIEEMVEYYGFTDEQAIYAVDQCGLE